LINLYVTSRTERTGKTMLCAGLAKSWLDAGKKVGYLKYPASLGENLTADQDSLFMQKVWGVDSPGSPEKDIILIEGKLDSLAQSLGGQDDKKVLVLHDFNDPLPAAIAEYRKIGSALIGAVVNKVPRREMETGRNKFGVGLGIAYISFLGLIPEDRILMSLSVDDLAQAVQGKIVSNAGNNSDLIENLMIGNSTFERGPGYYARKDKKAVLLWGERLGFRKAAVANLQLAALQTSTRCLVIANNAAPLPAALQKADEQKVSIISAPGTLPEIAAAIEKAFQNLEFGQTAKMPRLQEILKGSLDLPKIETLIGFH
jgi:BioD-like phosphotransacetylase family protein